MDSILEARAKLKVPQAFYDWCHDLQHCSAIGWDEPLVDGSKPDIFADLVEAAYNSLKANNYDYRVLGLYIWSSTKLRLAYSNEEYGLSDIKFLSFAQENRAPFCLPVQLLRLYDENIDIRLKLGGEWITLRAFLDLLVLAAPVDPAKMAYIWKKSGQSFRVLDLPRELRDQIWYYALFEKESTIITPFRFSRRGAKIVRCHQGSFHNVALMGPEIHRQVQEEVKQILYTKSAFNFRSTLAFSTFQSGIRPQTWVMIRRLELEFGYEQWLRILGACLSTRVRFAGCRSLAGLKTLKLKELKISFRTPSDLEIGRSRLFYNNKGCHTKVVQWIVALLVPVLAEVDMKELKVEGYIKHFQKERFLTRLKRRKDFNEVKDVNPEDLVEDGDESGGVSLENPRAKAIMAAMPEYTEEPEEFDMMYDPDEIYPEQELPPTCVCKHRCTLDGEEFLKHLGGDDMSILGL